MAILLGLGCARQSTDSDSVPNSKIDTIQQLIQKAKDSVQLPFEIRKAFLKKAKNEAFTLTNDTIILEQLSEISLAYKTLEDSLEFRETNKQVMIMSQETDMFTPLGNSHWDLASFFKSYGALDSAFYHYKKALNSFEQLPKSIPSDITKARILYSMGQIQDSYKDYLGAEISTTSALRIFDEQGDTKRIYNCYNLLAIIASGMGDSDKSLEYYEKAGSYLDKLPSVNTIRTIFQNQNNIAHELLRKEDYSLAKTSYERLLSNKSLRDKDIELYSLANTSLAYAIFKSENKFDEPEQLLIKSIEINDSINYLDDKARAKQYYAELLAAKGDTANALQYAKESRTVARETHNNDRLLEVLQLLTQLDKANAANYANAYYELNEVIKEEERTKRDKFARIRLDTDKIKEENVLLSRERQLWAGAVLGLVVLGLTTTVIVLQYINNNRLKFKQKQQESNQEIYNLMLSQQGKFEEGRQLEQKRISEELHDGILGEMLGIRLLLSGLNERGDSASVEQRAAFIEKLREVEEDIRTISHELNHASYEKFHNFIVSLEELVSSIQKSSGISCSFTYDKKVHWDNLLGDIKINAYRIVQETLKNCVKHAKCKNIAISFGSTDDKLKLTIKDDGVGFDTNKGKRGIGLRNIISRVKKINGVFDIQSIKGKGTTISVSIPTKYIESEQTKDPITLKPAMNA
ncbi:tetratricopeptide repeat-containing sensor histidine kinase [Flagellimonas taeanensis]|uniref:tetratricopeptide repeat-containing sensor histidine kinase n=1 Tax=Flagellimonas taeanensis TaxID=1005926 RepID=UPI0011600CBF|nr:ATP-binding protein [Allomuricauda taeanensis]